MPSNQTASPVAPPPAAPKERVWRVELLGGLRAYPPDGTSGDDRAAFAVEAFRTHKTALLLARLALAPHRVHAREELADLLWPDVPADRGRARLAQTLVYLRTALRLDRADGWIIADHKTIRLARDRVQTDVAEWEADARSALSAAAPSPEAVARLRAALSADRGELAPGFYDEWICDERNRLAGLRDEMEARLAEWESEATNFPVSSPRHKAIDAPSHGDTFDADARDFPALLNAPLFLTRFFGRDAERALLTDLLREEPPVRLITLLGMGGIGKTRLAAQAALPPAGYGWAAFVPMESAITAAQMESTLLSALGVESKDDALAAVVKYLQNRALAIGRASRLLLTLDNLEQLEERAAPVVALLLAQVPRLTILATSRQPVGIAGERELLLGPLCDDCGGDIIDADTPRDDARLFVDRARLARPAFALTEANRASVARLCGLLEGVPLALELAATWMRVSTPEQIAALLDHRFGILALHGASAASGPAAKRHRSLRAVVAGSYDLLGPALQAFWIRLSVFHGGWTAEAARAITQTDNVEEPLTILAERSLILAETDDATGDIRYRMLESLREFALEHLQARGDDFYAETCLHHARYFDDLSREAYARTVDGRGVRLARRLAEPERDNLRGVFGRLRELREGTLRLTPSLGEAFIATSIRSVVASAWLFGTEWRAYSDLATRAVATLPSAPQVSLRAALLSVQGMQAMLGGDYDSARRMLRESLALWESLDEEAEAATVKGRQGALACHSGKPEQAFTLWSEVLEFARRTGDLRRESAMLSNIAAVESDPARRRAGAEQAVLLDRKHWYGSTSHSCSLNSLGLIAFQQGDFATARECLREAHEIALADGSVGMIAVAKASLGDLYEEIGESLEQAEDFLREAQALYEQLEEHPRIAHTALARFRVALKRGDASAALCHARTYLNENRDANLMGVAAWREAREEIIRQLCDAGHDDAASALQRAA